MSIRVGYSSGFRAPVAFDEDMHIELVGGGENTDRRMAKIINVEDLECEDCTNKVKSKIPFAKGVKDVVVSLEDRTVSVKYDASKNSDAQLIETFRKIDINAVVVDAQ